MKKTLLIAVALACVTLLASVAEAVPQKSSAAAHKRRASHQKSQPQSIALDRPPLDESAVKWSCEHNKAFWLSGDFKSDPSLTLYWSGRNYLLPRVPTTTGAERFQDSDSGLDLVVLPFKAMLFNDHGARSRLVDECKTVEMAAADAQPKPMPLLFSADSEEPDSAAAAHAPFSASKTPSATRQ
ncbi:conserved exported hypothetical protein [Candidatus Glomeribacter gigasporarum BEG34]|uniref:Uncharacterized protein n=1 Tax=Candidatus Glomeribacter gigasporarum BEG34 TaxID=1070319 RepID=G2J7U7_9BURK|nr:hypothetical protein [Candidatus Glomeribacter gigasporarum]CCD28842.1 conserved exported hypothetical protein [Candidatus Glomeribacter gigasporarum BEG34]